ncbi:MAG TPA: DUF5716 family protein [Bacillota bacterium]|nr:DUF5716 family protein [Bacillota bacterium]HPJ85986.1 DUF5716 family protein [Bacillota bacterium]HPQ61993.1 DUF5716 family protein [Bacillota bacterium]
MELFQIIPENFFNLLAGKNRILYMNALLEVFKAYERGSILGMDKQLAQQAIIDYLDMNPQEEYVIDIDEQIDTEASNREKANQILRRLEECEWIDVDVDNDYVEIVNFRDYAITIIEALKSLSLETIYGPDDDSHEFRGYIYTAYSLLTNEHGEYAMVVDQVYKNTVAFVRELRKLDSRLKYYIRQIVEKSEIRDLVHLLVSYKVELVDHAYYRLKTSDNVNKYKLEIVKRLEAMQQNPVVMEVIAREYLIKSNNNYDLAKVKANKRIDDMIDIYNSLERIIDEIDEKNRVYVNTTIAKIKFLLNDDENVIGKLSAILKYTANMAKKHKTEKALKEISPLFTLSSHQQISKNSIFTPRGAYARADAQYLQENAETQDSKLEEEFYQEFETDFSSDVIMKYLMEYFRKRPSIKASEIIREDMTDEAILRLLYILIYAGDELDYSIVPLQKEIEHSRFRLQDFEIIRGYES